MDERTSVAPVRETYIPLEISACVFLYISTGQLSFSWNNQCTKDRHLDCDIISYFRVNFGTEEKREMSSLVEF